MGPTQVPRQAGRCLSHDGLLGAGDLAAEGLVGPEQFGKELVNPLPRCVLCQTEFLENDLLLLLQLIVVEPWGSCHIREKVNRELEVLARNLHPVGRHLLLGTRVQDATDTFDRFGDDLSRRKTRSPLEQHVLNKMSDSLFICRLISGTGSKSKRHRH